VALAVNRKLGGGESRFGVDGALFRFSAKPEGDRVRARLVFSHAHRAFLGGSCGGDFEGECWHDMAPLSDNERERGSVSLPPAPKGSLPAMRDHALTGVGQQDRMDALIRRNRALLADVRMTVAWAREIAATAEEIGLASADLRRRARAARGTRGCGKRSKVHSAGDGKQKFCPEDHPACRSDNFIRKKCALARSGGPGTSWGDKGAGRKPAGPQLSCAQCPAPRSRGDVELFSTLHLPFPQFLSLPGHATSVGFAGRLSTSQGTSLWPFRKYTGDGRSDRRSFDRRCGDIVDPGLVAGLTAPHGP
jgi:hypothetical protein